MCNRKGPAATGWDSACRHERYPVDVATIRRPLPGNKTATPVMWITEPGV